MSKGRILPILAVTLMTALSGIGATTAHHSLSGVYDTAANASFQGVIREFHFVNPHPYLMVEIRPNGRSERWKMELDNRVELVAIGMTGTTFRSGDQITVSGNPGLAGAKTLYVRKLERSKDRFWYEQDETTPAMGFLGRNDK